MSQALEHNSYSNAGDTKQGRIQDFKLGGGVALKQIAASGGRCEIFWGISCEKSRFYAKKIIFFPIAEGGAKMLGYFVWKITILRQKNFFSPILGGARPGGATPPPPPPPPPWIRPCQGSMLKGLINKLNIKSFWILIFDIVDVQITNLLHLSFLFSGWLGRGRCGSSVTLLD